MGRKNMDRWLGDGGMPIIGLVGGAFTGYGVDGEDLGWVVGTFTPEELACNPHGITQAGIHSLILDACMNFAINSALSGRDRTRGTLEMKTETMRPAMKGTSYAIRGDVVRMAKQVAYGEAVVRDAEGALISRATGTFLSSIGNNPLHRAELERVLGPGPGVCLICCGPTAVGFACCFACQTVARRLNRPLSPVLPISLCPVPGPLYSALVAYKESSLAETRHRYFPLILDAFCGFIARHRQCVEAVLGGSVDVVLAVPSSRRPSLAPLDRVPEARRPDGRHPQRDRSVAGELAP